MTTSTNTVAPGQPAFKVLGAISFSHFLNDTIQSLMLAIYPLFKTGFGLNFTQIGLITLTFQCTASLLQPVVGFMLASAFPAILVYAQELFPTRIGTVSGLFFGLAFGLAGIGAGVLGQLAGRWGIAAVYQLCAYLPLIGLLAVFLPDIRHPGEALVTPEANKA